MTGNELRRVLDRALEILAQSEHELRDLDGAVGDGDLGITVSRGAHAGRQAIAALPATAAPADILRALASAIASANPSSFAALVATGLLAAARSIGGATTLTKNEVAAMGRDAASAIAKRGKSEVADKTVLDALVPSIASLEATSADAALAAMIAAARQGVDETTPTISRRGRASWLGERTKGHPDPGAIAYLRFLESLQQASAEIKQQRP